MVEQNEQQYWQKFLDKSIRLTKNINDKELFYKGVVIAVLPDKLILNDRKLGESPISFEKLSLITINQQG